METVILNSNKEIAFQELIAYGPSLQNLVDFSKTNKCIIKNTIYKCKQNQSI